MRLPWPNMFYLVWFGHNVALEVGIFVAGLHGNG